MLRILQHITENLILVLALSALGRRGERIRVWCPGLRGERRQRAPGIKLAARPVQLAGADVPAAEDGVSAVGLRPVGEERCLSGGELAVADVALVLEGVVF